MYHEAQIMALRVNFGEAVQVVRELASNPESPRRREREDSTLINLEWDGRKTACRLFDDDTSANVQSKLDMIVKVVRNDPS